MYREGLPEKEALADAEAELDELYADAEEAPEHDHAMDLEAVVEEQQALRELLQKQTSEMEELKKKLALLTSEEAACATFLASGAGRAIVKNLTRLEEDNAALGIVVSTMRELLLVVKTDLLSGRPDASTAACGLISEALASISGATPESVSKTSPS